MLPVFTSSFTKNQPLRNSATIIIPSLLLFYYCTKIMGSPITISSLDRALLDVCNVVMDVYVKHTKKSKKKNGSIRLRGTQRSVKYLFGEANIA